MFRYIVAALCGISLTGSVYMAGWGTKPVSSDVCDDCCEPAAVVTSVKMPEGVTDMKNTKCIVETGNDVGTSTKFVTYKEKGYHICCADCVAEFNKEPEKYVKAFDADPAKFGVKK